MGLVIGVKSEQGSRSGSCGGITSFLGRHFPNVDRTWPLVAAQPRAERRRHGSLLSFEGPRAEDLGSTASAKLENCTIAKKGIYAARAFGCGGVKHRPCLRARKELTVKMLRAHGGCLGTRSRRRTWTAAISRGEALNSL